jgi:hypothetical protein
VSRVAVPALVCALACAQLSCSLAFAPRPPPRGPCGTVGRLALPVADLGVAVAAVSFGTLRALDPLCNTAAPCPPGQRNFSALAFGALVAAPFAISSVLGFRWRSQCLEREPRPEPEPER